MQSDQSFLCPHEETMHPLLSKMRQVKILIRLRECTGNAHVDQILRWTHMSGDVFSYVTDHIILVSLYFKINISDNTVEPK